MHSIKQKPSSPNLPNFTQLGVLFRIGITLVFFGALHELIISNSVTDFVTRFSVMVSSFSPIVLTILLGLYFLSKPLSNRPYWFSSMVVVLWCELCAVTWLWLSNALVFDLQKTWLLTPSIVIFLLYYFRVRELALSPAITEARLQALQARIRPHFLFNSLNAVLVLIRIDPRKAERVLENFAELFRVLMADNRQLVPLAKELELAKQYLEIEQVRLGDRLQLEWHVSKMPGDAMIPPLVLQPLLENAVYHGIERSVGVGNIGVNIYYKGNEVFIQIRNSHRVSESAPHEGNKMALANIRERLMLHFDMEAEISAQPGHDYFQVMIRMPYQKEAK
ncbi:histidine kinase [Leeia sp. TBRC 13508]|uniref:Histidine kinase n=1 Tax=Leeia speluncae TaxID=2884804 RepID=A0ABS8D3J4_9NEIS|nr:histidine kinase [Leeia speluncae]MCB6182751.1 histidine kinase [Leeia speluncae]